MFLEQQRFWMELTNALPEWKDEDVFLEYVPERHRDFSTPPGWPVRKAYNFLVNNVDVIRKNHEALEAGRRLDYDMLNHILSEGRLALIDWGGLEEIRARRHARSRVGSRIETLVAVSPKNGVNPGTAFIRTTVERAIFFFAQYVDYRFSDPAYPDVSTGKFQIKTCLHPDCHRRFIRTPDTLLYCSDDCARADH